MPSVPAASPESTRIPLSDHIVGTILLITAATNVIAGRSTVFTLPVLVLTALAIAYVERNSFRAFLQPFPVSVPVAIFLSFAVLSAAWAVDAGATLAHTLFVLQILVQWHIVSRWLSLQPMRRIRHLAFWFVVAVFIGLAVLLNEVLAEQYIRRWLVETFGVLAPPTLGKHYVLDKAGNLHIHSFETNRSIATLNMYLWPTLLCAFSLWSGRKLALIAVALVSGALLATMGSDHETSKLALVGGILCFLLASYRSRVALVAVACAWIALGLAVVPAARIVHDGLQLHEAGWVQHSAQRRVEIWDHMADRVADAPLIGTGARSAYVLMRERGAERDAASAAGDEGDMVANHAHNVYLQTWYELGLVGVLLFVGAGLAALGATRRLSQSVQPYALATFTVFMVEIGSSWEIWQRWFASLFALTLIYLLLAIRSAEAEPKA